MTHRTPVFILLFLFLTTLSGCDTIIDIFQAGIWFTIISITVIIILLVLLLSFRVIYPQRVAPASVLQLVVVLLLSFRGISPQRVAEPKPEQRSDLDLP